MADPVVLHLLNVANTHQLDTTTRNEDTLQLSLSRFPSIRGTVSAPQTPASRPASRARSYEVDNEYSTPIGSRRKSPAISHRTSQTPTQTVRALSEPELLDKRNRPQAALSFSCSLDVVFDRAIVMCQSTWQLESCSDLVFAVPLQPSWVVTRVYVRAGTFEMNSAVIGFGDAEGYLPGPYGSQPPAIAEQFDVFVPDVFRFPVPPVSRKIKEITVEYVLHSRLPYLSNQPVAAGPFQNYWTISVPTPRCSLSRFDVHLTHPSHAIGCNVPLRVLQTSQNFLRCEFDQEQPHVLGHGGVTLQIGCDFSSAVLTEPTARGGALCAILLSPQAQHQQQPAIDRNIVIAIDKSRSMHGSTVEVIIGVVGEMLRSCRQTDFVTLLCFGSVIDTWQPQLVRCDTQSSAIALAWLEKSLANLEEGTDIVGAMTAGLETLKKQATPEALKHIFLITDGHIGNERAVITASKGSPDVQIHICGVGPFVNTHALRSIAATSRGTFHVALTTRQLKTTLEAMFSAASNVVSAAVTLEAPPSAVLPLRNLQRNQPLVDAATLLETPTTVKICGSFSRFSTPRTWEKTLLPVAFSSENHNGLGLVNFFAETLTAAAESAGASEAELVELACHLSFPAPSTRLVIFPVVAGEDRRASSTSTACVSGVKAFFFLLSKRDFATRRPYLAAAQDVVVLAPVASHTGSVAYTRRNTLVSKAMESYIWRGRPGLWHDRVSEKKQIEGSTLETAQKPKRSATAVREAANRLSIPPLRTVYYA
eukprot:TRINITY_DN29167_c0_g1_i1.p1 TRINITY_DN29167_c0_g1~~TRINITY_DN29167_c0_g1_i1.p1  ORF type:complete len:774 (+),score=65.45 TRINITY_DN29167_c0_g1_i1:35-2323(+)